MKLASTKKPIVKNSRPNKKLAIRKDKFVIPEQFLNTLEEFSNGGFILIIGNEAGEPQAYSHFDGGIQGMGLAKFGKDYFTKLDRQFTETIDEYANEAQE
jgi:hypothetical protein